MKQATTSLTIFLVLFTAGCARQYAVSVNDQTVYDPRARVAQMQFADPGLQACVNMIMQAQQLDTAAGVTVLTCPGLEIRSLAGLDALPNLQFLDVSDNRLTHLDGLRTLTRLRSITASGNPLNDISSLLNIASLNVAVFGNSADIPCAQLDRLAERLGANLTRPQNCSG